MRVKRLFGPAFAGSLVFIAQVAGAAAIQEDFSSDPSARGWNAFGMNQLFSWDPTNQNLRVTWDSSRPNSYFYHGLGTILTRNDDFSVAFDLRLTDILPGANTNKSGAFELAIGLLNFKEASSTNFLRGTGINSPDLVEFDYFPDAGFGATIWPTFISTNSSFNYSGPTDYTSLAMSTGDWFHVLMTYTASNTTLATIMTRNGDAYGPVNSVVLSTNFTDFRVDTFSLSSYSDTGDDFDSLLAHGSVDNLVITSPPLPITGMTGQWVAQNTWEVQFNSLTNWSYALERTTNFSSWTSVTTNQAGTGSRLALQDTQTTPSPSFYRVSAQRP